MWHVYLPPLSIVQLKPDCNVECVNGSPHMLQPIIAAADTKLHGLAPSTMLVHKHFTSRPAFVVLNAA